MSSANPTTLVEYRPVVGFPFYRVGSDGSVWTSIQAIGRKRVIGDRWRRMNPRPQKTTGYITVSLKKELGGKLYTRTIHRLVLEAFIGPRPPGMEARHFPDASKTNNQISNLSWGTAAENTRDSMEQGKTLRGTRQRHAKLTEFDIPVIREMQRQGVSVTKIARRFGICEANATRIIRRERWKHVA